MAKFIRYNIITLGISIFLLLGLVSCNKEGLFEPKTGYLKLGISQDKSVVVKSDETIYNVKVLNSSDVIVASYENHNELVDTPLKLKEGTYKIVATTGNGDNEAAFDQPFYSGESSVAIVAGKTATANVVCTLAQVKVTVNYDEAVQANFKEIIVTVTNGTDFTDGNRNLVFSSLDGTIEKEGYFRNTGALKYSVYLKNNKDEISNGDVCGTLAPVKEREHYILNLTLSDEDEGAAVIPGISVDDDTNEKYFDVTVNLNKKAKPVYSATGFELQGITYISIGTEADRSVNIISKAGIHSLIVKHENDYLSNLGIPRSVDLAVSASAEKDAFLNGGIALSGDVNESKDLTLNFSNLIKGLPLGEYKFTMETMDKQNQMVIQELSFKVIPAEEASTLSNGSIPFLNSPGGTSWAKQGYLYGMYNTLEVPAGLGFEYKVDGATAWNKVTSDLVFDGTNYYVKLTGLTPNTTYRYRAVTDKEPSQTECTFTTLGAEQIYNMSFDAWYKSGKHYYANESNANSWWDSGNEGANTLSEVNPTKPEESFVAVSGTGKKAARLGSTTAAGQFAAGSLFLGDFVKATLSPLGANLNFGRPYGCKPLNMKGYYCYTPGEINKAKSPYEDKKGTTDLCSIYVILTDWADGYFQVNTGENIFIDIEKDPNIIGYGCLKDEDCVSTNGAYKAFNIPIEYRNNRIPTTCVIVCSSSKYGDYFTGSTSSVLYVDEFEFTF